MKILANLQECFRIASSLIDSLKDKRVCETPHTKIVYSQHIFYSFDLWSVPYPEISNVYDNRQQYCGRILDQKYPFTKKGFFHCTNTNYVKMWDQVHSTQKLFLSLLFLCNFYVFSTFKLLFLAYSANLCFLPCSHVQRSAFDINSFITILINTSQSPNTLLPRALPSGPVFRHSLSMPVFCLKVTMMFIYTFVTIKSGLR